MTQDEMERDLQESRQQLRELNEQLEAVRRRIRALMKQCTHPKTEYWQDPSGNNGGGPVCQVCGEDL